MKPTIHVVICGAKSSLCFYLFHFLEGLVLAEKEFVGGPDCQFLSRPEVYEYVLSKVVHFIRKAKEWNLNDQEAFWAIG